MAIVEIDKVLEKRSERGFSVNGKEYTAPDYSYDTFLEIMEKENEMRQLMLDAASGKTKEVEGEETEAADKESNVAKVLRLQFEMVCLMVPDMTVQIMMEDLTSQQAKEVIKLTQMYLMDSDEQEDAEVKYYREKYKDEYRKNLPKAEESSNE